jgi:hypothetical protein
MKNYLKEYKNTSVKKFQMGGSMPAEGAPAPAPVEEAVPGQEGGADLQSMILQVVETQDPQLALEVVNLIAEQAGLTGAPAAPEGAPAAPAAPEGIPQGKFGMKIPKLKVRK